MVTKKIPSTRSVRVCDFCDRRVSGDYTSCDACDKDICSNHTHSFYRTGQDFETDVCPDCWKKIEWIHKRIEAAEEELSEAMAEFRKVLDD